MNNSALTILPLVMALATSAFATPAITDVTAQQRYPWNGKVDITYSVSGDIAVAAKDGIFFPSLKVMATDNDTGATYTATALSGDANLADGTHSIVWDMDADGIVFTSSNVVFSVACETTPATYCVINLAAGKDASSYPVTYLAEPPSGGFTTDEYKTTKLVLKRIEAGTFIMGEDQTDELHRVTLTKPFFMGLYEMTQKQWSLVMGFNPSYYGGDKHPVGRVVYNTHIRGSSNGTQWPASNAVDSSSFLGKLRARTGLDFDLPTEAQWEYACRAGTTTTYSYGNSANGDYMWYHANSGDQPHEVGTKRPNPWGLYDMHGNMEELCLDWYDRSLSYGTDPKGSSTGTGRVTRGDYYSTWTGLTSSSRSSWDPSNIQYSSGIGFRLSRPLTTNAQSAPLCFGKSEPTFVDFASGTHTAALTETIRYSTAWETDAAGATAVVAVNGEALSTAAGTGATVWQPTKTGTCTLTHQVFVDGEQVGATLTAIFRVLEPEAPAISPVGGVVEGWPISVSISCATEGATIHYTTDGTEPTKDSPVYRRFRISEYTTVKAVAIKDGVTSEVAVAEYALGRCEDPVITPADGTEFEHSGQSVSIAWQGEDGVLRYTTDGSDPTADSPVYAGPFTIDDSTVVKAKAFGDQFFDSAVVTANLTRVWVNVATPTITAAASFTGSETKVALSCATSGATIRYTLNGNDPNSHSTRYAGPFYVADSCTVKAYATCHDYLDSAVATQSIEKVRGIGDTMGAPDHAFSTETDYPFVRVTDTTAPLGESMKSGAITHSQTSTLSTTVMGPGTISFQWKTSCEKDPDDFYEWDHAAFTVDGTVVAKLDGESGWQTFSHAIADDGEHTLEWRYVKDNVESEGEDCCWVAGYHWASAYTATQTTPAPVPYVWLRGHFPHTPDEYDAYESAAKSAAANDLNTVWECYVAGLSPTDAADVFRTVISMDGEGNPVITWEPDLNEGGTKQERVYTVEGRENLTDGVWGPTNAASRFFRVKVGMP